MQIETHGDIDGKGTNRATWCEVCALPPCRCRHRGETPHCPSPTHHQLAPPTASTTLLQETKEFNLYLGVGFYGMNLKHVAGAGPPPRDTDTPDTHEFDLVTRKYVERATATAWVAGRALDHFGTE